jgi:uncharacterized membrane protein
VTAYATLKFAHIVGAIAWVGSGIGLAVLAHQLRRSRDLVALVAVGEQSQGLGKILFMPAALVTVAAGIALVTIEPAFGFADLWVLIGFGGIIGSGVAQMAVAEPTNRRFMTLAAERGVEDPETLAAGRRVSVGNALDIAILLFVVWAMVAKPAL